MNTFFITAMIAGYQWLIILLIILLLFGGKKIPELMKGVGKGVRAFKEGMNEVEDVQSGTATKKPADDSKKSTADEASKPTADDSNHSN